MVNDAVVTANRPVRVHMPKTAAAKYIRQEPTLWEPVDGTLVTRETSAAAWTLAHKGYSGSGRLDVWIYASERAALRAGAELAIECGLFEHEQQARKLFKAGKFAQVLDLYEQAHPGNLLRAQPAFFVTEP